MKKSLFTLLFSLSAIFISNAQNTVEVEIVNFDSNKGMAYVALYNSEGTFLKKELKGGMTDIQNQMAKLTFRDLPDGEYAISVFHDADGNGELTTNFLGIPKEKYGASNDAPARFGPPKWNDARFDVRNNSIVKQKITL